MAEASEGSLAAGAPVRAAGLEQTAAASQTVSRNRFALTTERRRSLRISVILFGATFLIYWLLGPMHTAYDFQLSQANNIVHGHLDMDPAYTEQPECARTRAFRRPGFCLPLPDPRAGQNNTYTIPVQQTADCRHFMQHSLGPAFLLTPLAFFFGLTVNQTLVSALIGALAAPVVWGITRRFSHHLRDSAGTDRAGPVRDHILLQCSRRQRLALRPYDGCVLHLLCHLCHGRDAQPVARRRVRGRRVHVPPNDDPRRVLPAGCLLRPLARARQERRHERLAPVARSSPAAAAGPAGGGCGAVRAADNGGQLHSLRPPVRIGLQLHRADLPGRPCLGVSLRHLRSALCDAPHPGVLRADADLLHRGLLCVAVVGGHGIVGRLAGTADRTVRHPSALPPSDASVCRRACRVMRVPR